MELGHIYPPDITADKPSDQSFSSNQITSLAFRVAYISDRPDLFETKILRIKKSSGGPSQRKILVSTRDPGSANALLPIIRELTKVHSLQIDLVTDGRAEEIMTRAFQVENITPKEMILGGDLSIGAPDLMLIDISTSEIGIDTYVVATFSEVPYILIEDYYTTTLPFLSELIKRNLRLPEKICVIDNAAKELIVEKFPQLEDRIEVTGQPTFDRLARENIEQQSADQIKEKLGIHPSDKLVTFVSTMDEPAKVKQIAESLSPIADSFYFIFRRHPRDNLSYAEYKKIFSSLGIKIIESDAFSIDEVCIASDLIVTTWSTEGLNGIYRRKPTIHLIDQRFSFPKSLSLPLPPVKLGASIGIDNASEVGEVFLQLLNPSSALSQKLHDKMERHYPADGKNTERVMSVLRAYFV